MLEDYLFVIGILLMAQVIVVTLGLLVWSLIWVYRDAEQRGKLAGGPALHEQHLVALRDRHQFAEIGLVKLFFFLCMLSMNLAFLNVLPIPLLDGGHLGLRYCW